MRIREITKARTLKEKLRKPLLLKTAFFANTWVQSRVFSVHPRCASTRFESLVPERASLLLAPTPAWLPSDQNSKRLPFSLAMSRLITSYTPPLDLKASWDSSSRLIIFYPARRHRTLFGRLCDPQLNSVSSCPSSLTDANTRQVSRTCFGIPSTKMLFREFMRVTLHFSHWKLHRTSGGFTHLG